MSQDVQLIIDTDPGQDDAAAILMAMGWHIQKKLTLKAILTVAGNVPVEYTSKNACIINDWAGVQDVPIYKGNSTPILKKLITAEQVHGKTGLDGVLLHEPKTTLEKEHAINYLVKTLNKAEEGSITLVAIGPLTNLGLAFTLDPKCVKGLKEIIIMGGNFFEPGNITPTSDFNFFVDPIAAQIVMQSKATIRIVPLDVTHKALITNQRMQKLRDLPNENGRRVADILQSYERFDIQTFGLEGGPLHDPCAIMYVLHPEVFKSKDVYLEVETSSQKTEATSMVDWHALLNKEPNVTWCYDIDADAFFEEFTHAISALP